MDNVLIELDAKKILLNDQINIYKTELINMINSIENYDILLIDNLINKIKNRNTLSLELKDINNLELNIISINKHFNKIKETDYKNLESRSRSRSTSLSLSLSNNNTELSYADKLKGKSDPIKSPSWADECEDEEKNNSDGVDFKLVNKKKTNISSSDISYTNKNKTQHPKCTHCGNNHIGECFKCRTCSKHHNPNVVCKFNRIKLNNK